MENSQALLGNWGIKENSIYGGIKQDSMKDLKLRIIHGPLHSTTENTVCCLCCRDTMGELSVEERVVKLTCGFTRQSFPKDLPPDIIDLCVSYVGTSKEFDRKLLKSFAENRQDGRLHFIEGCEQFLTVCCEECWSCEIFFGNGFCCDCWTDMIENCCSACCKCWQCFHCCTNYHCCFGFCGDILLVILLLGAIGITFGKDIAALIINNNKNCDISAGSGYVYFNVYEWVLIGSISDSTLCIMIICFILCLLYENVALKCNDKARGIFMEYLLVTMGCLCCFFIAWIVIGFLLYTEMIVDTDISDQCKDIVMSWNILQLIPTTSVICFIFLIMADEGMFEHCCQECIDNCGECSGAVTDCCKGYCLNPTWVCIVRDFVVLMVVTFLFGKDVSSLIINSNNDCDITEKGKRYIKLFDVSEWLYIGSITHMVTGIMFICWTYLLHLMEPSYIRWGILFFACGFLFNISWTVIGFLFYNEMIVANVSGSACGDIVLCWSVMQSVETVVLVLLWCIACCRN